MKGITSPPAIGLEGVMPSMCAHMRDRRICRPSMPVEETVRSVFVFVFDTNTKVFVTSPDPFKSSSEMRG